MEIKELMEKMDAAAAEARKALDPKTINTSSDPVKEVANWMKQWYPEAGYKRLSKILIELAD
jgi:tetrahydromethanopterin S-methyltransferase subunit B